MHDSFFSYINRYSQTTLTDSDKELLRRVFLPKKFRKKQYFSQEGDVDKYMGFVVKGAMKQFSVDEKGVEHIVQLSIENWWVGDRESFFMSKPSIYNIDAWEDSDMLLITKADWLTILEKIPAITELRNVKAEGYAIAAQRRLNSTISYSAEKRYDEFSKNYPELLCRFPQHIVASYLGITKETLSRIRKHSMQK